MQDQFFIISLYFLTLLSYYYVYSPFMLDIFITCFFVYCGDLSGNNIRNLTQNVYSGLVNLELCFLAPFLSFSRPFNSRYILRFILFLAAVKRLSVNYGQTLDMGS